MNSRRCVLVPLLAMLAGCGGVPPEPVPSRAPSSVIASSPRASATAEASPASPSEAAPTSSASPSPERPSAAAPTASASRSPSAVTRPLGHLGPLKPADFSSTVDNQWFPLVPGASWTLLGVKDRKRAEDVFTVLPTTEVVAGVECVIVSDDLSLNGVPTERTTAYFARHRDGSVWFFGEDIHHLNSKGQVISLDGSWRAGLDRAVPGLMMPAHPKVGDAFDQKTAHAHFEVLAVAKPVEVPAGAFPKTLVIEESDSSEPGIKARKFYAPSIGEVRDVSVGGPLEEMKLFEFRRP